MRSHPIDLGEGLLPGAPPLRMLTDSQSRRIAPGPPRQLLEQLRARANGSKPRRNGPKRGRHQVPVRLPTVPAWRFGVWCSGLQVRGQGFGGQGLGFEELGLEV